MSAYFTINAYGELQEKLEHIDKLRFLFGEPQFVSNVDQGNKDSRSYILMDQKLELQHQFVQRKLARDCAQWIKK